MVVTSAAGKRSSSDHKLTDLLYLCHAHITYGVSCEDIADTIRGFRMILDGECDDLPEQAFHNVGTIEDAIEKGRKLLEQAAAAK